MTVGLVENYLADDPSLRSFYRLHPDALLQEPASSAAWASGMADALRQYQESLGCPKSVTGEEAVIATGQQPGIFTGPLYSIYKAITAIQLAERYSQAHGILCLPVFWVAGDDHDFEEVRTAHLLTKQFEPLALTYSPEAYVEGAAMYQTPADASLHDMLDEAAARCSGACRDEVAPFLHESLDAAQSVAEWFSFIMARLFRDTPLTLFVPHLEAARRGAAPVIAREIAEPLASTRANNEAAARIESLGYPPQVVKGADECNFFLDFGGRRRKVLWDGTAFHVPAEHLHVSQEDMAHLLESNPERFSANVVIRPVVQQALFPVSAYVGGPGELAYWLQLRGVFERHGLSMPVVYPRAQALLLDTKTRKLRDKFNFAPADWMQPLDVIESRAVLGAISNPALEALRSQRPALSESLSTLAEAISRGGGKDRSVGDRAHAFAEHTLANLDKLEEALAQSDKQQADAVRAQARRVANIIAPMRKPQERVYGMLPWLFEHGWDLVPRLMERMDATKRGVQEIEL